MDPFPVMEGYLAGENLSVTKTMTGVMQTSSVWPRVMSVRGRTNFLLCSSTGNNSASAATEAHLESRSLSDVLSGCYVLRLNDDLEDHESQEYKTARMFRAYFPTDELPTV